jgi:sugar/nucleoside kinase (ribokinase family)
MVVVYGTVCLDRLREVPRLPDQGGYVEIAAERQALGGEAANTCAALRSWGAKCRLVGNSLGSGHEAQLIEEALGECGLDDSLFPVRDHPSPYCDIYVTPDGERTMFGRGFVEMEERHGLDVIPWGDASWLALDDNHLKAARTALTEAVSRGIKVYALDFCRPNEPLTPEVFWQSSTVWSGSRNETSRSRAWLDEWVARHGCRCVLTDGHKGFFYGEPGRPTKLLPAFPCPKLVDSTGAGDAFRAGMLYGLELAWPLARCLSFASACGALSCTRLGGAANAPTVSDIESLISRHPEVAEVHQREVP